VLKHFVTVVALVAVASAGRVSAQATRPDPSKQDEQVQARYNILVMEGVLERAVKHGADQLRRQVRKVMPDMLLLSGEAQARGFRLEGYGVFFDVSVPLMRQSVAWSLRTMMHDNTAAAGAALQQIKAAIERMAPDGGEKATLLQALKRLEIQVNPRSPLVEGPAVQAAQRTPEPGSVASLETAPSQPPSQPTQEEMELLEDPNGAYEREVINALKDAMLNHSGSIRIGPEEWLTIAAHDNEQRNRLMSAEAYDLMTIVLRVKGTDLAAFRADRIPLDEARKRILVSEF
jgi:hypothetical protein